MFGEGVAVSNRRGAASSRRGAASSVGDGRSSKSDASSNGAAPDSGSAPRATVPKTIAVAAASPGAPDGGIGTPLLFAASGLVVVLAGVGAGLLIRRRSGG